MDIKWHKEKWYAVWYEGGKTKRQSLKTTDRDEARRNLVDFQKAMARPLTMVEEIVEAYMADKATGPSAETNKFAWQAMKASFGHLRPDQITRDACRAYVEKRRSAKKSDNTIHRELGVLNAALRWHDRNTPAIVELPSKPPPKDRYITREQVKRLIEAVPSRAPHIGLFISIAYRTAARSEAILELTWDRVDLKRGQIRFATGMHRHKGRATVPINRTLLRDLEAARPGAQTDFVIEYAGRQVASIKKAFARCADRAGLQDLTPHGLRHAAAIHMAEAGKPMQEISQYLGHSSTKVTERTYARYSPDYLRDASSALEDDEPEPDDDDQ